MSVAATARSPLTKDSFPAALVDAVGETNLAAMLEIQVEETGTGYLDGCFNYGMIPCAGAIKGTDQYGRVYITFCVQNMSRKTIGLVTVFQRFSNQSEIFYHRGADFITSNQTISVDMTPDKYALIKQIFQGTHPILKLERQSFSTSWSDWGP